MENGARNLIYILTLIALVLSLAIPLYCIPTALVALFRRSPFAPWPPLLVTLGWVVQWPAIFVLAFTLPGCTQYWGRWTGIDPIRPSNALRFCPLQRGAVLLGLSPPTALFSRRIAANRVATWVRQPKR